MVATNIACGVIKTQIYIEATKIFRFSHIEEIKHLILLQIKIDILI